MKRQPPLRPGFRRIERLEQRMPLSADLGLPHDNVDHDSIHRAAIHGDADHLHHDFASPQSGDGDVHMVYDARMHDGTESIQADTPTEESSEPNIRLISAYVRDGLGNPIDAPFLGQRLAIQVQFETVNLPEGAEHAFHFTVDGVTLGSGILNTGSGQAIYNGFRWRAGWFATPGTHQVSVTADAFDTVMENNETDNTLSFSFTTGQANFTPKLIWPVEGVPYSDHAFLNYVDVDPGSGIRDFKGGSYAYNGHSAWDIAVRGYDQQDDGIEIYASADGIVTRTHDGEFDRQTNLGSTFPPVNFVTLDHGDGWTTRYVHLRRDSVIVEVGQSVVAGQVLGYMASSGWSDITHLHFALEHHGFSVEPWYDPATFLAPEVASLEYIGINQSVLSSGISNIPVNQFIREGNSEVNLFRQQSNQLVYTWNWFSGAEQGDALRLDWRQPDGTLFTSIHRTFANDWAHQWRWYSRTLPFEPQLGNWTIEVFVNNLQVNEQTFVIAQEGIPKARILQGAQLIVDDRVTPIDFGTLNQFSGTATQNFTIENHGEADLLIGNITVPSEFSIANSLPSTLTPGQSATLSIQLPTLTAGHHAGQVRIETNDPDQDTLEFSIEAVVTSVSQPQQLILGINERKTLAGTTVYGNVRRDEAGNGWSGPLTVQLSSDAPAVVIPPNITIPAGSDRAIFPIVIPTSVASNGDTIVTFTASSNLTATASNELRVLSIPTPPQVRDVLINDGAISRSSINSVHVFFDQVVDIDLESNPSAITLSDRDRAQLIPIDVATLTIDGKSVLLITPSSPIGDDGNLLLTIKSAGVQSQGLPLDGDGDSEVTTDDDYLFGQYPSDGFFRFFGDADGDRDVDPQDLGMLSQTLMKSAGHPDFDAAFDYDSNGVIDGNDYTPFRARLQRRLPH